MITTITDDILERGRSKKGSWSRKQIDILGVKYEKPFKLPKGWKKRICGKQISLRKLTLFLELKDKHLKGKK
jgi:hypothetical protein